MRIMKIVGIEDENFTNYKKPAMFIAFPYCTFKCGKENCQNKTLDSIPPLNMSPNILIERYLTNPITKALVIGGLEPFDSWEDIQCLIMNFRYYSPDDIVIYSGYNEDEIEEEKIDWLRLYSEEGPIIVKWGRYIPGGEGYFNEDLGVKLASKNQYTVRYVP